MKNTDLANKIKELRNQAGLSQELLAEKCRLSLRTVQRIENGESAPRGDSLNRLAGVLNIPVRELFDQPEHVDKSYTALMNVSALSFLLIPFLGALVPLVFWILKKDKVKNLSQNAQKLLNFQITWCIVLSFYYAYALGLISLRLELFPENFGEPEYIFFSFIGLYGLNILLIMINTIRSASGQIVVYQPAIPFLRLT